MKILFLASFFTDINIEMGGHYFSMAIIAKHVARRHCVTVCVLGEKVPAALREDYCGEVKHVYASKRKDANALRHVGALLREVRPDIVHTFDPEANRAAKRFSMKYGIRHVITKAGGPVQIVSQTAPEITVFSGEDVDWFTGHPLFRRCNITQIANRVERFVPNYARVRALDGVLDHGCATILAIARVTGEKRAQLRGTADLTRALRARGERVQALLIGDVQDRDFEAELRRDYADGVVLLTSSEYVRKARDYIAAADYVVGMGRSIIEAMSLGKVVLSCAEGLRYPYFLDEQTFEAAYKNNFSARAKVKVTDDDTVERFACYLSDDVRRREVEAFSTDCFSRHFDVTTGVSKYEAVYARARPSEPGRLERVKQIIYYLCKNGMRVPLRNKKRV